MQEIHNNTRVRCVVGGLQANAWPLGPSVRQGYGATLPGKLLRLHWINLGAGLNGGLRAPYGRLT